MQQQQRGTTAASRLTLMDICDDKLRNCGGTKRIVKHDKFLETHKNIKQKQSFYETDNKVINKTMWLAKKRKKIQESFRRKQVLKKALKALKLNLVCSHIKAVESVNNFVFLKTLRRFSISTADQKGLCRKFWFVGEKYVTLSLFLWNAQTEKKPQAGKPLGIC